MRVKQQFFRVLAAGNYDSITHFSQRFGDPLAVLALDLDHAVFDRTTAAAQLFEPGRQLLQFIFKQHKLFYQCYSLSAAALRVAVQIDGLLVRRERWGPAHEVLRFAQVSLIGRPYGPVLILGHVVSIP